MKHFTETQVKAMRKINKKVPQKQIAELLGCSIATVRRRLDPLEAEKNRIYARGYAAGKRAAK